MTTITREQAQKIIDAADEVITALAGTNDDFHPDNSEKMCGLWDDLNDRYAPPEVVRELARAMLASMDAEPAGYHVIKECGKIGCSVATLEEAEKTRDFWNKKWTIRPYFYSAAPAPVVPDAISTRQAISKMEECEPCDSINVAYKYGWNACRDAMLNGDTFRENPISSTNNFREISETSTNSPVIPEEIEPDSNNTYDYVDGWNACRAAMLQANQRDLSQPVDPQVAEYEQIMLQAGWVMVPIEPTDEMIAAAMECDDVVFDSKDPTAFCVQFREIYYAMVDAAPKQEGNNG